jgi:outer membrane lipoprotein-sorting protein
MNRFRYRLLGWIIIGTFAASATLTWAAPPLMQLGQALGKRYNSVRTFVANVSMQGWSSSMGQVDYDGRAFFMQPNLFRIDYARSDEATDTSSQVTAASAEGSPPMSTLVSNSSGLFRWNPDANAWASTRDSEDQVVALLSHITNLAAISSGDFMNMYAVSNPQDARVGGRACYVIHLQPRQRGRGMFSAARQTIYFDRRTLLPVRAMVQVPGQRRVTVDFRDIKLNRRLGLDVFGMRG